MSTEAQKRASEKYRLSHKEYYNKKSKEYAKKVRQDKDIYKARIDKAIEYIKDRFDEDKGIWIIDCYDLLNILQNGSDEE